MLDAFLSFQNFKNICGIHFPELVVWYKVLLMQDLFHFVDFIL